jgi:hypothetical protein
MVRALIDVGDLYVDGVVRCGEYLAAMLANGWLRLVKRADEPLSFCPWRRQWVLGCSANGWIEWWYLRDGELLAEKRDRWMRVLLSPERHVLGGKA